MRALLSLSLVAAIGGCSNSVDSLVVVDITADAPLSGVSAFAVTATAMATNKTATFRVSPPGGAATFDVDGAGQTFGIDLPKGITGPLHVHVDADDSMDTVLARGDGDTTVKAGARVDLPLTLNVSAAGNDMGDGSGGDMGPATGGPMLAIDRTSQTFGNVTVNQSSAAVAITVTNRGDQQTSAIMFTPSGANLDQFALNSDCGAVLMPNQSCHVNATFKPTSAGDKHAHFVVAATMGGMVAADLSGTGTPPGTVTISADAPANGDCGAALIGATSATVATYTVKNVGTAATGTPTVSTSDSTQFVASGCAAALQPNETCTVSVQFTAKQRGQQTASVSVTATPGGTANASASGVGQNPATFSVTSTSGTDFGSAAVGTTGAMLTLTATNVGDVTSPALIATNLTGANPTSFTIVTDGCNTGTVMANKSCDIVVKFTPQALNAQTAALNVRSSTTTLGSATLTGMGTAPGTLAISTDQPGNGNCGSTLINTTSTTMATYTVKNTGTSATGVPMVTTSDTTQFVASGCAAALQPNATCTISVTFTAKQHGTQTASVSVSATPGGTANASVSGVGQNPATFVITSTSGFDFGSAAMGTTGTTLTFKATNQGDVASAALIASNLTGANPTSFALANDLCSGATIAAGSACTVDVQFTPKSQGPLAATLNVRAATGTLGSASLSGTGTVPGTLSITADTPANGNCGSAIIGSTSTTMATYTVKNIGTSATGMPTVTTSDTSQFSASGCAVSMLAPNATCTVSVQFTAKHPGAQMATVTATATPGGTANASVSGTGLNPAAFTLTSSTNSFDFGSVQRTMPSSTIVVTAKNTGDVTSTTLTASLAGNDGSFAFTADTCSTKTVAAGATCSVTVQMTPKNSGAESATLQLVGGGSTLGSQTMTGTGTPIWVRELSAGNTDGSVLRSVWAADTVANHVWAVGDNQAIYARNSAGAWVSQATTYATPPNYKHITGSGPTDLWAIYDVGYLHSGGDGTWKAQGISSATSVGGLQVFSANDAWVMSTNTTGLGSTYMQTSSAIKITQSSQTSETALQGCQAIWGASESDLYCAYFGANCHTSCVYFWGIGHRDASGTWTTSDQVGGATAGSSIPGALDIWGLTATNIYFMNDKARPLHWDGSAWTAVDPSAPLGALGAWGSGPTNVYFVGPFGIAQGDGTTWGAPYQPNGLSAVGIYGTGANNIYVVGSDANGMCVYHWF